MSDAKYLWQLVEETSVEDTDYLLIAKDTVLSAHKIVAQTLQNYVLNKEEALPFEAKISSLILGSDWFIDGGTTTLTLSSETHAFSLSAPCSDIVVGCTLALGDAIPCLIRVTSINETYTAGTAIVVSSTLIYNTAVNFKIYYSGLKIEGISGSGSSLVADVVLTNKLNTFLISSAEDQIFFGRRESMHSEGSSDWLTSNDSTYRAVRGTAFKSSYRMRATQDGYIAEANFGYGTLVPINSFFPSPEIRTIGNEIYLSVNSFMFASPGVYEIQLSISVQNPDTVDHRFALWLSSVDYATTDPNHFLGFFGSRNIDAGTTSTFFGSYKIVVLDSNVLVTKYSLFYYASNTSFDIVNPYITDNMERDQANFIEITKLQ